MTRSQTPKEKQTDGKLANVPDSGVWLTETFFNNLTCDEEIRNGASFVPVLNLFSLVKDQQADPVSSKRPMTKCCV